MRATGAAVVLAVLASTSDGFVVPAVGRAHRFRPLVRPLPAWGPTEQRQKPVLKFTASRSATRQRRGSDSPPTLDLTVVDPYTGASYVHFRQAPELLTKEEEVSLARLVQRRIQWEAVRNRLASEFGKEPTLSEWAVAVGFRGGYPLDEEFSQQVAEGDSAKAAMISANLRLVLSLARKHKASQGSRCLPLSDLVQEGILGLVKAVEKYDPERGFRFSTYATWWIRQTIARAVCDIGRTIRLPAHIHDSLRSVQRVGRSLSEELGRTASEEELAQRLGLTVEKLRWLHSCKYSEPISLSLQPGNGSGLRPDKQSLTSTVGDSVHDTNPTPEEYHNTMAIREDVDNLLSILTPREQTVLRMRYGLDSGGISETLEAIGVSIGVTRERVRQIERRALDRLRMLGACGDATAEAAREHVK
ncbi:RNA polymerase sigma-70 factor [Tribonema minus]|uniref:RNA polymerase sigma-70 factor n=1 Tax=Tribonema minus TaxID=303371 RepID=A0A836CM85_9STRA|nr:RNA polymerase sigma-70 factor [Tribonema minus]